MNTPSSKDINKWTRKELLKLPQRDRELTSVYDSLLVFITGQKHNSGWARMVIIGVIDGCPKEVITSDSDDIEWTVPYKLVYTDCVLKARALHFWTYGRQFIVETALPSIRVKAS